MLRYVGIVWFMFGVILFSGCGSSTESDLSDSSLQNSAMPLRIACVGDSITQGTGLANPSLESYPAQLSRMLPEGWEVQNFGKRSATLIKAGTLPYWSTNEYRASLTYEPDIVVIMLGTNDTKDSNWGKIGAYVSDYRALIEQYRALPSRPTIYIAYPPPVKSEVAGISDSRIRNGIIPKVKEVANLMGVGIIDAYSVLANKSGVFVDEVHPNTEGARLIAQEVYGAIY